MKGSAAVGRARVSADGHGVVSHAGMGLLRELADLTGLSTQVTAALADTYKCPWAYAPGAVFADLAAAVADGADCIDGVGQLCGDREHVFEAAASTTTMWRLVDQRVDAAHLPGVRAARAAARAAAWAAGAHPAPGDWLHIDIDATLIVDHSDNKENSAATWKKSFGHHPLLAFLDRPEIAGGEALAGLLRKGNAGSNTAADHITVLEQALASRPAQSSGAQGCGSFRFGRGHPRLRQGLPRSPRRILLRLPSRRTRAGRRDTPNRGNAWYPAIEATGDIRGGAWVAEATGLVNLFRWIEYWRR
ncbi:hypothetical protein LAUMK191_05504 [Mycobacterium attenuatum]|nr:hypothetical protein LAUMK191_05504 [Mycobacterium attenuatum]